MVIRPQTKFQPKRYPATTAILVGAFAATIGWLYTGRRARMLSRKQQTITVILNSSSNERFIGQRDKIARLLEPLTKKPHASENRMKDSPTPSLHEA
jgi:hypothetical protein